MKKILAAIIIIAVLAVPSCANVSMKDILAFQNGDYAAKLIVADENDPTEIDVTKYGSAYTFTVDGKYTFVYNGEKWQLSYNGLTVPLSGDTLKRSLPKKLLDALSAPCDGSWSIIEESADGTQLYICDCTARNVKFYIDSGTLLPVKIICGDTGFDVVKFEAPTANRP